MIANELFDLLVIGAGPGGYHAAIRGAQLGMKTAIVEMDDGTGIGGLGGVCLNWGCIPSKSLLKNAELVNHMKHAEEWGFTLEGFHADMSKAVDRSRAVSDKLTKGIGYLLRKNRIELLRGKGRLLSSTQTEIEGVGTAVSKNIVVATGARARGLPGIELDGEKIISSREALALREKPESICIIGASAIGCEFAYYFNAYGVKVLLLEALDRIVPKEDVDISKELERKFRESGIEVSAPAKVQGVESSAQGKPIVIYEVEGGVQRFECDKVLLGVGIQPNTDGIRLEETGVALNNGFIEVNGHMQTGVTGVYAVGDVTGKLPLAHAAFEQGVIAAETAAGLRPRPLEDYSAIPRCTYCQPEIASIGLTEQEARDKGIEVRVGKAPYLASGKAIAINSPDGFAKIVTNAESSEILGAHVIGANATEMIAELGMVSYLEGTSEELHRMNHAHPTLSEVLKEAAAAVSGEAIHF